MKDTKTASLVKIGPVTVVSPHCSSLMDDRDWTPVVAQLRAHAEDGHVVHVLLDLQWVKHVSIRFVTELDEFIRELVVCGSTLRLCGVREQLRDIFKLVCLEHLDLGKSVPDALPRYVALLRHSARDRKVCLSDTAN